MNFQNIKKAKIKHADIVEMFEFKNLQAFRSSSAHLRYMRGIDKLIERVLTDAKNKL